jgi:hypothetical protein
VLDGTRAHPGRAPGWPPPPWGLRGDQSHATRRTVTLIRRAGIPAREAAKLRCCGAARALPAPGDSGGIGTPWRRSLGPAARHRGRAAQARPSCMGPGSRPQPSGPSTKLRWGKSGLSWRALPTFPDSWVGPATATQQAWSGIAQGHTDPRVTLPPSPRIVDKATFPQSRYINCGPVAFPSTFHRKFAPFPGGSRAARHPNRVSSSRRAPARRCYGDQVERPSQAAINSAIGSALKPSRRLMGPRVGVVVVPIWHLAPGWLGPHPFLGRSRVERQRRAGLIPQSGLGRAAS